MKKFLKIITRFIIIIALICLVFKLDILGLLTLRVSDEKLSSYTEYYYNQLELDEKKMYVAIDETIKSKKVKTFLGSQKGDNLEEKISRVLTAYFYDNPECYYVSNEYTMYTRNFVFFEYSVVEFDYIVRASKIDERNEKMEKVINKLLNENIIDGMTDYEKELAIHDALVKYVSYYSYKEINQIPTIKHTAYGALVEGEAVCDGYAKALKILLDRVGIENIIVNQIDEEIAHAWNVVKLDGEYYHVDATSDKLEEGGSEQVIHTYFNITDEDMEKNYVSNVGFEYPECTATKYNYYIKEEYYVNYEDNLYEKLSEIMLKQKDSNIIEIKVDEQYNIRRIIDTLYNLNFGNWQSSGKSSITYSKLEDVYVFLK